MARIFMTALLASLDSALNQNFNAATNTQPGAEDYIFGGDMDQWRAFANTLKLKMYLRMVNAKPDVAEAGIKALYDANADFLNGRCRHHPMDRRRPTNRIRFMRRIFLR